ncbi:hypothetical protein MBLNU459_g7665t1 [Dothideomycetes sp. NU459]
MPICPIFDCFVLAFFVSFLIIGSSLVSAGPHPTLPSLPSLDGVKTVRVQDAAQSIAFDFPCTACLPDGADAVLAFDISHSPTGNTCEDIPLSLNGIPISRHQSSVTIPSGDHAVELWIDQLCDPDPSITSQSPYQALLFDLVGVDSRPIENPAAFSVVLSQSVPAEVLLEPAFHGVEYCASFSNIINPSSSIFGTEDIVPAETNNHDDTEPPSAEPESIEPPASDKDLRRRLQDQKKLMRQITMECQRRLIEDLEQCHHSISCSGKAICRHLRQAIQNLLSNVRELLHNSAMVSQERQQYQKIVIDEKTLDSNNTSFNSSSASTDSLDLDPTNPVVLALEILFSVLGLSAFFALVQRHCCSLRYRVERLANREERQRARHYRALARKEAFRKRWVAVKTVFSRLPRRNTNYEEKRSLILEAAAVAMADSQGLDLERAESSFARQQLNVANIHEGIIDLRHAHEIVTALLQAEQQHVATTASAGPVTTTVYVQEDARSRSSSLPSYNSENLPDYSSQPEYNSDSDSGSDVIVVANGFRPCSPSSSSGASALTAVTPESSVPDVSPRCSGETLRTDFSRGY